MTGLGTGSVYKLKREMAAQSQSSRHDASPLYPHKAAANFAAPNNSESCHNLHNYCREHSQQLTGQSARIETVGGGGALLSYHRKFREAPSEFGQLTAEVFRLLAMQPCWLLQSI